VCVIECDIVTSTMRRPRPTRAVEPLGKPSVIILKREMVFVLKKLKTQLAFGAMSCCFSVNGIFRVNLFTKEGNSVQIYYNNVEKSVKNPAG
jgi:hypothetical protein